MKKCLLATVCLLWGWLISATEPVHSEMDSILASVNGEAISLADRIGAGHTWLTHLSHTFPAHEEFCALLEQRCAGLSSPVLPAFDGLTIE